MLKYQDYLQDRHGNAIPNAQILVEALGTGIAAPIYADSGAVTVQANPTTSDADGYFSFHAAAGHYTLIITLPDGGTRTVADVFLPPDATSVGTTGNLNFALLTPDDGGVSASASLATAIISGLPIAVTKVTTGTYLLTVNATITKALWGMGGVLKVANGVVLTLNCPIYCPDGTPLFDLTLGGTLAGTPKVKDFMANWIVGCDPSFVTDSSPAIQAAINLCVGSNKPDVVILPGRYKIRSTITKTRSLSTPKIRGMGGSGNATGRTVTGQPPGNTGGVPTGCVLDASASSLGATQPIMKLAMISGEQSMGGVENITFYGNAVCKGLQLADCTGLQITNCTFNWCLGDCVHLLIETPTGFSAVEHNKFTHCVFYFQSGFAVHLEMASGNTAEHSFHGCSFDDCWFSFFAGATAAFLIGYGCKWYNGYLNCIMFFSANTILRQYGFLFQKANAHGTSDPHRPVSLGGGSIRTESGNRFIDGSHLAWPMARLACDIPQDESSIYGSGTVYYGGTISGLGAVHLGNLRLTDTMYYHGFESPDNGSARGISLRPYGFTYIPVDVDPTTGTASLTVSGATLTFLDLHIECQRGADPGLPERGGYYLSRHTGFAEVSDQGKVSGVLPLTPAATPTSARWLELRNRPLYGSATYSGSTITPAMGISTTVTVTGAALGDHVNTSFSNDLLGISLTSSVKSANTVEVRFENLTGDDHAPGSGTISCVVQKRVTATVDPGSLADGGSFLSTAISVSGATLGEPVDAAFNVDLQGIILTGYVSSAGNVKVIFQNETGAGPIALGSHTVTVITNISGTKSYDPGTLQDGSVLTLPITVNGVPFGLSGSGCFVDISCSANLLGVSLTGHVNAANTVTATFANNTGIPFGLVACTIHARVEQPARPGWLLQDAPGWGTAVVDIAPSGNITISNSKFPPCWESRTTAPTEGIMLNDVQVPEDSQIFYAPQIASGVDADVDLGTDVFTVPVLPLDDHPTTPTPYQKWQTGQQVVFTLDSGTITGTVGLTTGTSYYIIRVDATHVMLAETVTLAHAGTQIGLTGKASPVWNLELVPFEVNDKIQYLSPYNVVFTSVIKGFDRALHRIDITQPVVRFTPVYPYGIDTGAKIKVMPVWARVIVWPIAVPYHAFGQSVYTSGEASSLVFPRVP
jgi:hypothetical protein